MPEDDLLVQFEETSINGEVVIKADIVFDKRSLWFAD